MATSTTNQHTDVQSSGRASSLPEQNADVCSVLCGILLEGMDFHRALAAQALSRIGGEEAIDALIKSLLDEDEDVRTDAATGLAGLGDPKANEQLLENLVGDPCPEVKMAAISALSQSGNDDVKPWLLKILAGRDEEIAWDEDEFYASGWDDWADMQVKAMNALADLGVEEAVPGIVAAINDDDGLDIIDTAMKALARIGPSGITALAGYLDNSDERRRRRAAASLAKCEGPEAMKAISRALQDSSSEVRLAVARGLAEKNPADERLPILLLDKEAHVRAEGVGLCGAYNEDRMDLLLDDKDPGVQQAVLELLSGHPELTNIPTLGERVRELLHSPSVPVAASAALALTVVSSEKAVSELAELLAQENIAAEVRRGAIRGLKRVGGDDALQALITLLGGNDRQLRLESMGAIADLAEEGDWPNAAGNSLLAALSGELVPEPETDPEATEETTREDDSKEESAAENESDGNTDPEEVAVDDEPEGDQFPTSTLDSIMSVGKAEAAAPPLEDVELSSEDIEFLSLSGGGKQKGRRTLPVVPDVVAHEDVRLFAARLLSKFAQPEVTVALLDPLSSDDIELKQTAVQSLAHITANVSELPDEVLQALLAEAKSSNLDIRRQAIRALGGAKDAAVVMVLINALDDEDSFVRTEAIRSLGRLGEAGAGVSRFLEDPEAFVRLEAAQALAETGASGIVETLVDYAFSFEGYHGREASRLLAGIDKQAANALFIEALHDDDRKRYWKVAIEALEELNQNRASAHAPA
jgi:HEAT repeat protein